MANLLYVNAKKRGRKKHRTAAQRAATRKMIAANRKRTPVRHRSRKRHHVVHHASRKRRVTHHRMHHASRRRQRSHNPLGLSVGSITHQLRGAVVGAVGAVGVDFLQAKLPIPINFNSGRMRYATSIGLALALGLLTKRFLPGFAGDMVRGSLTVTAYKAVQDFFPMLSPMQMAGLGYVSPAMDAGSYMDNTVGLLTAGNDTLGEYVSGVGEYVS